ncbi:hypothetical protein IQ249_22335 [Lusitaniella coriacea LEGE 07157]|uniref:Uncharacterized protein n=1 Tax=Lusitaniella coriacea LEGE 07157 TaxID=945747 RepID=A0A8J7E1T3_9CYAN|nr:hypothetical protein [Lusitaniella coriacea]MBE9118632.1 hypothetical protein [Lusitaniella coriacea LEGE 07157]
MDAEKVTTRKQLQGYGATRYQAQVVTKNLTPVAKQNRAYAYALTDVITSIREYLQRPRIKATTRQTLEIVLQSLLERLGNVLQVPFTRGTDPELSQLAKQLTQAMCGTDRALAELKATAATIKGKYST